jgi:hypothetical protein
MLGQIKIKNKISFLKQFLYPISKISDSAVLEIKSNTLTALVCTSDNSIIFHSSFPIETEIDSRFLNCPDIKKLIRALDAIKEKGELVFNVEENHLAYSDTFIRFKYHLLEDDIIKKPKLSLKKLETMEISSNFNLEYDTIKEVIKGSVFSSESNKFYLNSDETFVYAELTDRTRNNIDTITIKLSDKFYGNKIDSMPLNFEIFFILFDNCFIDISSLVPIFKKYSFVFFLSKK